MRVSHNIEPYYSRDSKILILGTMPSLKSREEGFYYAHPQNRFWSALAYIFKEEIPSSIEAKKVFLKKHKIALWDVLKACDIKGSDDSSIKNPVPNDISRLLKKTAITNIYVTGKKALFLYNKFILKETNINPIYLPSTSPANIQITEEQLKKSFEIIKNNLK